MKIISWNVNGLRSIFKNNFLSLLGMLNPDIFCLQEIKAQKNQLSQKLLRLEGYHCYFNFANKKGYSGVAVYSKDKPLKVERLIGLRRFDQEGRMLRLDYFGFTLFNLYFPHGGRQKENLDYKLRVYSTFVDYLTKIRKKQIILIGDFNIAHRAVDLARPNENVNNTMFTKEERLMMDKLINLGFIDTFRMFTKEGDWYSWFPYGFNARERNLGWRIDYAFVSKKLTPRVSNSSILREVYGSDHCPILLEIR